METKRIIVHLVDKRNIGYRRGFVKGILFVGGILGPLTLGYYAQVKALEKEVAELKAAAEEKGKTETIERIK